MDSNEVRHIILTALQDKLGTRRLACPFSGDGDDVIWDVLPATTTLPSQEDPSAPSHMPESVYPMAAVTCRDCGYTMLVNLIVLGVAEQLGITVGSDGE